jgi:hypothetical protein
MVFQGNIPASRKKVYESDLIEEVFIDSDERPRGTRCGNNGSRNGYQPTE